MALLNYGLSCQRLKTAIKHLHIVEFKAIKGSNCYWRDHLDLAQQTFNQVLRWRLERYEEIFED